MWKISTFEEQIRKKMKYENYKIGAVGLYQSSKTPQEGFEKTEYGTDKKITYIKKIDKIEGVITEIDTKEIEFDGRKMKMLEVTMVSGDTQHKIGVSLKNQKGSNYSDAAIALLSALNGYKIGQRASLSAYWKKSTGKNGKEYNNLSVAINHLDILTSENKPEWTGFVPFTDIPKATSKEVAGDTVWDFTPVMEFWYEKFTALKEKFSEAPAPASEAPKPAPSAQTVTLEDSDLPF